MAYETHDLKEAKRNTADYNMSISHDKQDRAIFWLKEPTGLRRGLGEILLNNTVINIP